MKVSKQTLRLQRRIQDLDLLPPDSRILIGVSGGADSMALLHILAGLRTTYKWHLEVAHLHHGLRGKAADADARFVADQCDERKIPCHIGHARIRLQARSSNQSVEMLAREARHRFFRRLVRQGKFDRVALAHTQDDQAETVLLRLLRGAGLQGLGGMSPDTQLSGLHVVRPLLTTSKAELMEWLRSNDLSWREDESNLSPEFQRNRVRTQILPLLKREFNPEIVAALNRTAAGLRLDAELVLDVAKSDLKSVVSAAAVDLNRWEKLSVARRRRVLLHWLQQHGVEPDFDMLIKVEALCAKHSGTVRMSLPNDRAVVRRYDQLTLQTGTPAPRIARPIKLPRSGAVRANEWQVEVGAAIGFRKPRQQAVGKWPATAYLSARRVGRAPLYLRTIQPGDRFAPLGMEGSRKIQDILTDLKVPRDRRNEMPVLECRGELVWLPGYCVARGWAVEGRDAASLRIRIQRAKGLDS